MVTTMGMQLGQMQMFTSNASANVCVQVANTSTVVGQLAKELTVEVRRRSNRVARSGPSLPVSATRSSTALVTTQFVSEVSIEIHAEGAESLMGELCRFGNELEQASINEGIEASYYQLYWAVRGRALDVLRLELIYGTGLDYKKRLVQATQQQLAQEERDLIGSKLYHHILQCIRRVLVQHQRRPKEWLWILNDM